MQNVTNVAGAALRHHDDLVHSALCSIGEGILAQAESGI